MGPILCSKELPKSSLFNIAIQQSFFNSVERRKWVLSTTAGQNPQFQHCFSQEVCNSVEVQKSVISSPVESYQKVACPIQMFNGVSLTVLQKGRGGFCQQQDKTLSIKMFFSQGVCNSVEFQKWVLSAAVETREIP